MKKKRLIDADSLCDMITATFPAMTYNAMYMAIEKAPTVDAVEVVHGRWEDFCRDKMCCCSVCKAEFDNTCNEIHDEWYYCPNCGAKMDGDTD